VLQPGGFTSTALLRSYHAPEVPTGTYGKPWAQKMSKNGIRQAASALTVKNSLILSIICTFCVKSARICKQFHGSLACSTGQAIPLLVYIFTESQNGRGWKGPLWVI